MYCEKDGVSINNIPKVWNFLFALMLVLFVVQPWSISFGAVPLQVLLVVLIGLWILLFRGGVDRNVITVFSPFQWFCVFVILFSVLGRTYLNNGNYLRLSQIVVGVILALASSKFISNYESRKIILNSLVVVSIVSSLVSVMQFFYLADWSWGKTLYQGAMSRQPSGLESYPVAFSYSIVGVVTFSICQIFYYFYNRFICGSFNFWVIIFFAGMPLMLVGLMMSQSRSGFAGVVIGVISASCFFNRVGVRFIHPVVLILVGFTIMSLMNYQKIFKDDISFASKYSDIASDSRIVQNWEIFFPWIMKYPFGIAYDESADGKDQKGDIFYAFKANQGYAPHNFILTITFYYGIPAGLATLMFYFSIFSRVFVFLKKNGDQIDICQLFYVVVFFSANLALVVHSWFHNASLFFGEMRGWFWVGSLIGVMKYANYGLQRD